LLVPIGELDLIQYMFFGLPELVSSNGISIGSAVFAGLTNVTNRQSNRQTNTPTTLLRL